MRNEVPSSHQGKSVPILIAGMISLFFGLLTIFAGGSVILDLFGMREKEGNYVLFVVWANFICGFLYVFASYGFFTRKVWTKTILKYGLYILITAFVVLIVWIVRNEPYETKTVFALSFRILVTVGLYWAAKSIKIRN